MSEQLSLPMGSGDGTEHTLCVACGLRSQFGYVFCDPCTERLARAGRSLDARQKNNQKPKKGVVPKSDRVRHRPFRPTT